MILKTKTISYDNRVRFFWFLVAVSILSLFTYVYAVSATARHIAVRQGLEKEIADVTTNLDALEFQYIETKNNITLELAHHYGFKEARNPLYISRTPNDSLTFNTLER